MLNANDILEILQRGIQQRQTAATLCNKNSSRSHSIFTMKIMIKEYNIEGEEVIRNGQLNLVDLAGSECIGRSGAKNDRAREAGSINQSLLTLGRVITALVDHHPHVPYRDSKLTRLLQESLGGKAKTCIIATFSPAQAAVEETLSTLDYAHRAKNIKNQPTVNQKLTKKVIMKEYFAEIETLRTQLLATREKNGVYLSPEDYYAMESRIATQEAQLSECEGALRARNEEVKTLRDQHEALTGDLAHTKAELQRVRDELAAAQAAQEIAQRHATDVYRVWQSTETVVGEQQRHEGLLVQAGETLKRQLHAAEGDVSSLLRKVSTLEDAEALRLRATESFCGDLDAEHSGLLLRLRDLQSETQAMQAASATQLDALLSAARDTQRDVRGAVEAQIATLVAQQTTQVAAQQAALSETEAALWAEKTQTMAALQRLQSQLDDWLRGCAAAAEQTQAALETQTATVAALVEDVDGSQRNLQQAAAAFAAEQTTLSQSLVAQFDELARTLTRDMAALQTQLAAARASQETALTQKTAKIAAAMQTLLAELQTEQAAAFAQQAADVATAQQAHEAALQRGQTQLVEGGLQRDLPQATQSFTAAVAHELRQQQVAVSRHATQATAAATQLRGEQAAFAQSVGHKRKLVADHVTDADAAQDAAAKRQCQRLAQLRDALQSDAADAARQLTQLDGGVRDALAAFVDEALPSQTSALADGVEAFGAAHAAAVAQQQRDTAELQQRSAAFAGAARESVTRVSGQTPRKPLAVLSPVLSRARPANVIRREVLAQPTQVAYATVAQLMPGLFAAVTSVADVDVEADAVAPVQLQMDVVDEPATQAAVAVAADDDDVSVATAASKVTSRSTSRSSSRSNSSGSAKGASLKIDMPLDGLVDAAMGGDVENLPPNSSACSSAAATPSGAASKSKLPVTRAARSAKTADLGASGHVSLRSTRNNSAFFNADA